MSIINSFLQKTKLQESRHGFYMVLAAYALSFLLLVIGSDMFYNIKSRAEGENLPFDETTKITENENIINPYGLTQTASVRTASAPRRTPAVSDDTNWLLGYAMNSEEYGTLLGNMDHALVFKENKTENENTSIASLSITEDPKTKQKASKEEVAMLERIVEAEATGEDMVGKILIVNVIFNRIKDEEFPDSIEEVIFQKVGGEYQFSPISDKRYWKVEVTKDTKEAVKKALEGEDYSEGALYFMARKRTRKSSAKWFDQNLDWLFKHGGHEFYK